GARPPVRRRPTGSRPPPRRQRHGSPPGRGGDPRVGSAEAHGEGDREGGERVHETSVQGPEGPSGQSRSRGEGRTPREHGCPPWGRSVSRSRAHRGAPPPEGSAHRGPRAEPRDVPYRRDGLTRST